MRAMLLTALLAPLAFVLPAQAASFGPYDQAAFEAAQAQGKPIVLYIEASWCPTCAKQRPILSELYKDPAFATLQVMSIDFDTAKDLLASLHVTKQSTLIAYHGKQERDRATGVTDPEKLRAILVSSAG